MFIEKFNRFFLQNLNSLRLENKLCDVTFLISGRKFHAHKVVLSAGSNYFKNMFMNDMIESNNKQIVLNDVDASAFDYILQFFYTNEIEISTENAQVILELADMLDVEAVIEYSWIFMVKLIDLDNCCATFDLAYSRNLKEFYRRCENFIRDNYWKLVKNGNFLMMSSILIKRLLEGDRIDVDNENDLLDSVRKWIAHNNNKILSSDIDEILQKIRWSFVKFQLLDDLFEYDINYYKSIKSVNRKLREYSENRLLLVGGSLDNSQATDNVELLGLKRNTTVEFVNMLEKRSLHSVGRLGNVIYAIGGENERCQSNTIEYYDLIEEDVQWKYMKNHLPRPLSAASIATYEEDSIMVLYGGYSGSELSNEIVLYNENKWETCGYLNSKRASSCSCIMNGYTYLIGGIDEYGNGIKNVEKHNISIDKWTSLSNLNDPLYGSCAVEYKTNIYLFGGANNETAIANNSVYMYCSQVNKWTIPTSKSKLNKRRLGACAILVKDLIYIIGGSDCNKPNSILYNDIEIFEPRKMSFMINDSTTNILPRSFFSVVNIV